ncbi:MAG: DUF6713 family protein [Candidatus Binatia bacterium]
MQPAPTASRGLERLYALTAALLFTHEIDAAYWHEWELFHLPGALPGFLALHVPLLLLAFWGHRQLVVGARAGLWASLALAAAGLFALIVHGGLLLAGHAEFRAAASVGLLAAVGAVSLALGVRVLRVLR